MVTRPESRVKDIDEAWAALDIAFGDPTRLLRSRMEKLFKLGMLPKENAKGGLKSQVEWYLEIEAMLKSIIDLGSKDEELDKLAFNKNTIGDIIKMFPSHIVRKLLKCTGTGRKKLENITEKVSDLRIEAQEHFNLVGTGSHSASGGAGGGGGSQIGKVHHVKHTRHDFQGMNAYNPPRTDERCQICLTLESRGDTSQLYDNHIHRYPTGCPRYISLSVEERRKICMEAKLCMHCHDPEYVWKRSDKDHKCPIKSGGSRKSRYTCTERNCANHMWICTRHRDQNTENLKNFQEEIS